MVIGTLSKSFTKIFGTRNDRLLKTYYRRVEQINALEPEVRLLTDEQLAVKTEEFRATIAGGTPVQEVLPEVLAVAREVMDRAVGIRNIFNPEYNFDASQLPSHLQPVYERIKGECEGLEPKEVMGGEPAPPWQQVAIPNEIYDAVREIYPQSRPPFRARPFDVQLIGGMVLGEGRIAEMKTGEGKTIVAPLACYVACVESLQCHVVTVNDYLVQRDRDWVFPFYLHLGLTVGAIHPFHSQPPQMKKQAYECDVLYGTNSEFGFDYLRDNMKLSTEEQMQKRRDFVIIDEVDSILIDEARTPLIISGPAHDDAPRYGLADQVARHLMEQQKLWDQAELQVEQSLMRLKGLEGDVRNSRDKAKANEMRDEIKQLQEKLPQLEAERDQYTQYYEVEREKKASHLTHEGVAEAQKIANIGSFYVGNNMDFPHLLENALRAHVIYQRDKDYVVQNNEVIIVDEFTGRLMVGRQWSDGLHQAVESKERVEIKQETQTMATVTIQNYFKLYKRRAGMTGTAITEATEFGEIYDLEVLCIPTNVPVIRDDRNDLIYLSGKDKWDAILDEVKLSHDVGRPVLVGTTSVEKSEFLSQKLTKKHGIQHAVLNAKQHERESAIVSDAGELGAVMIATNMAGRGTDIKLLSIDREKLVRHWQQRNLLPRDAKVDMSDEVLIEKSYRHQAAVTLKLKGKESEERTLDELKRDLFAVWVEKYAYVDRGDPATMSIDELTAYLDQVPNFLLHRLKIWTSIERMGGLHIIGTERHESRRIDNQLRGRAGRQGDRGSSRFFISLEDDLMKMFAGKTTMTALSKLGMKEGDAIEHRWITKSVERAQRKVEERNYQIRKNLLEYDEVMEFQRGAFYGTRQAVLDGHDVEDIIFDYIGGAVEDAVNLYLARDYVATQIAEWCRQNLDISVDPLRLVNYKADEIDDLHKTIRKDARSEAVQIVDVTLGEYMSNDIPPDEWDLRGLSQWAMSRFSVDLKQNQVRKMNPDEVKQVLVEAAHEQIDKKKLDGVALYLEPAYGEKQLLNWVKQKFDVDLELSVIQSDATERREDQQERVIEIILEKSREQYAEREVVYPIEFALDMTFQMAQQDGPQAAAELCRWVNHRYEKGWTPEQVMSRSRADLRTELVADAREWLNGDRLAKLIDGAMAEHKDAESLSAWARQRLGQEVMPEDDLSRDALMAIGRRMYRSELTRLERFVLLQILDGAWKDHLYAMDQLKDSVGLRGYAEKDPRIEYKREGASHFASMQQVIQERVTELIFRAKLTPNVQQRNVYDNAEARKDEAGSAIGRGAPAPTAQQQADQDAANRAGSDGGDRERAMTRKARRAAASRESSSGSKGRSSSPKKRKRR